MHNFDVIVVGAGLAGRLFALGLAKGGLRVASIDHESPENILNQASDGRTTAITLGSMRLFDRLGLWESIAPHAQPIMYIRAFEQGSPWTIDYDAKDISSDPMGYIAENFYIRSALYAQSPDSLHVFAPTSIKSMERNEKEAIVELTTGEVLRAPLVVAADGRHSKTRAQTSIYATTKDYNQKALVAHIIHEKPHNNTAFEVFTQHGPLAVLPMKDDPQTGHAKSGLVWCKEKNFDWESLATADLETLFKKEFPYYGNVTFGAQRWVHSLSYTKVSSMIDQRVIIIGDAAHVVHPIAGLGINLGWRDADVLIDDLLKAKSLGQDLGCPHLLAAYDKSRKFDRLSVLWVTDGINLLYKTNFLPVRFARNAAFAVLNKIKPFKASIMKRAMGI